MSRALRVRITGVVQGVGYRAWADRTARSHGLHGWVRNRRDGSVEAVIAGDDAAVDAMLAAFRRGPASSSVDEVITEPAQLPDIGFQVLPTT